MEKKASFWPRHRWLAWVLGGLLAALVIAAVVADMAIKQAEPFLRARVLEVLQDRFHARVELDGFHVSLMDGIRADGTGLRIWPPLQAGGVTVPASTEPVEPLIRLDEFRFHAPLHYERGKPFHVSLVELKGLEVKLPPRSHFTHAAEGAGQSNAGRAMLSLAVDEIECNGAHLVLGTSKPGKQPLDFAIAHFTLKDVSKGGPMGFDAELTNPRPVGTIHSSGSFGPWIVDDPGESAITGDYTFDHADLSGFKGIAGILNSTGHYQGTLRDLVVDGDAAVPDFRLAHFDKALALSTHFHAKVDATNGDTWLEPVDATLGHSHFTAQGQIVRVMAPGPDGEPQSRGHDIALAVNVDHGRIEDFLRLASHSDAPLLTGAVTVKTRLHIPPGQQPVHERMELGGRFSLDQARFASTKIQDRIDELSLRGQGRPGEAKKPGATDVVSTMKGNFTMAGGVITLPDLEYMVPGAEIDLAGTYEMEDGGLDFKGMAKLQATVSQMVGGWKGMLLKPLDRYFKRNGAGTEVPIHIGGTRDHPDFGIDLDRFKGTSLQGLGEKP